jgi:hypothetical protein
MAGPGIQSLEEQTEKSEENKQSSTSQLQQFLANRQARQQQQRLATNDSAFENLGSTDNAAAESSACDNQIAALVLSLPSQEEKSWRSARLLRFQEDAQLQESYEKALTEWKSFDFLV